MEFEVEGVRMHRSLSEWKQIQSTAFPSMEKMAGKMQTNLGGKLSLA